MVSLFICTGLKDRSATTNMAENLTYSQASQSSIYVYNVYDNTFNIKSLFSDSDGFTQMHQSKADAQVW